MVFTDSKRSTTQVFSKKSNYSIEAGFIYIHLSKNSLSVSATSIKVCVSSNSTSSSKANGDQQSIKVF
eukprot:1158356-Pelagomonas_calceolata.AAC.1